MIRFIIRSLANSSLRREGAKAEQEIEGLNEEIEERQEQLEVQKRVLDREFEDKKVFLENQLKKDEEFLQNVYPGLVLYTQHEMKKRQIMLHKEFLKFSLAQYDQQQSQLEAWILSIDTDIHQLEEFKETLVAQADIESHLELARMHQPNIPAPDDPAILQKLYSIRDTLKTGQQPTPQFHSLTKLIGYVVAKNEFLKDIQYIQWVIGMKRTNQIRFGQRKKEVGKAFRSTLKQMRAVNVALSNQKLILEKVAYEIRRHWEEPKAEIQEMREEVFAILEEIDPHDSYKELKEEKNFQFDRLANVKREIQSCYNTQNYDNLDGLKAKKEQIKRAIDAISTKVKEIQPYKQKLYELRQELQHWKARERMVFDQLKELDIFLLRGKNHDNHRLQAQ